MAFNRGIGGFMNTQQRRLLFAVAIVVLALAFIPFTSSMVLDFLNWQLGSTEFTVGTIVAIVGLFAAYQIWRESI